MSVNFRRLIEKTECKISRITWLIFLFICVVMGGWVNGRRDGKNWGEVIHITKIILGFGLIGCILFFYAMFNYEMVEFNLHIHLSLIVYSCVVVISWVISMFLTLRCCWILMVDHIGFNLFE